MRALCKAIVTTFFLITSYNSFAPSPRFMLYPPLPPKKKYIKKHDNNKNQKDNNHLMLIKIRSIKLQCIDITIFSRKSIPMCYILQKQDINFTSHFSVSLVYLDHSFGIKFYLQQKCPIIIVCIYFSA